MTVLAARAVTPLVLGVFLLIYIGIAFVSDEALVTLMELIRSKPLLVLLAALMPANLALRAALEARDAVRRRTLLRGGLPVEGGLFDAEVVLPVAGRWENLPDWLTARGYRVFPRGEQLSARRGLPLAPARVLFLLGCCCLVIGVILSLLMRASFRTTLIEGEPLPPAVDERAVVQRLILRDDPRALVLERKLVIQVGGGMVGERSLRLYPPGRVSGYFVYPRYLGLAPLVAVSAPGLAARPPAYYTLMIYPPGKEDAVELAGTPYKIWLSLESPTTGVDPLVSGEMALRFRVVRGGDVAFEGRLPVGETFNRDGFTLSIPEVRKLVVTDFIRDNGLDLIWLATFLLAGAFIYGVPVRLFAPRAELLFRRELGGVRACFRAEGREREHAGVFHEALDLLSDEQRQ
ncbi:MAG TPA: hypothetical protein VIU40_10305 [Geobacteraceae bacterium]